MTLEECTAILTPLALAMRADMDVATYRAYHRALQDIPAPLFAVAVDGYAQSTEGWFPKAPDLRAACERQRRALLAAHPYEGCADCEHSRGWTTVFVDGVPRAAVCACRGRHRAKLEALGLAEPVAALPGEAGAGEQAEYPTLEQLPSGVQRQVTAIAARKVLR